MNERLFDFDNNHFPTEQCHTLREVLWMKSLAKPQAYYRSPNARLFLLIDLYDDTDTVSALLLSHRDFVRKSYQTSRLSYTIFRI
jgi:hypothetical protein